MWTKDKSSYNSVFYIQKTILGGILIFTVEFNEPFFITKLHAIECNRLQNISSRASINRVSLIVLSTYIFIICDVNTKHNFSVYCKFLGRMR